MNDTPAASGSRQRDLELQQLVIAIQHSLDRKQPETRKQIDRLIRSILASLEPARAAFLSKWAGIVDIESIVAEAVNNTLVAIKNLDRYQPEQASFMTWINGILNFRFQDALRKYRSRYESISIDNQSLNAEAKIQEQIDRDDGIVDDLETDDMARKLWKFIMTDPEGHFVGTHIRNCPDATLQRILLMRLNRLKWQEIADRFNIAIHATINNFHVGLGIYL